MTTVQNALGFDLEHWYTATLLRDSLTDPIDRVVESTEIVLDILRRHDTTATFFVVGEVAETYPDLIGQIADEGHELASHGQTHRPLFELTPAEFRRELYDSRVAIGDAAGVDPEGFRAPNFSITRDTAWAFDVLDDSEYAYDSSVFPMWTPMYGVRDAPREPYTVRPDRPFTAAPHDAVDDDALVEVPMSVVGSHLRLPAAGGFYARVTPRVLFSRAIARLNDAGTPANLYFHPWEFNPAVRTDEPPLIARLISFTGVDRTRDLLDALLDQFAFGPVRRLCDDSPETDSPARIDSTTTT